MLPASAKTSPTHAPPIPTPLWALLAFTFINSLGTAVIDIGIFFIAKHAFAFTTTQSFALAIIFGLAYIPGAALIGPALRRATKQLPWLSTRAVLLALMLLITAICWLPYLAFTRSPNHPPTWPIWTLVCLYAVAAGALWPINHAYLAAARSPTSLRTAIGRFNITWTGSMFIAMLLLAPFIEDSIPKGLLALQLLGLAHLISAALLAFFPKDPTHTPPQQAPSHPPTPRDVSPAMAQDMLSVYRLLLPASFLVIAALAPYLPTVIEQIGIPKRLATIAASATLGIRVLAFITLQHSARWHSTWLTPTLAGLGLVVGYALTVLSPSLPLPHVTFFTGQVVLGAAMAATYAGALYFAMDVGDAQIDAGGTHEAIIGAGYTLGPVAGLLAILAADTGLIAAAHTDHLMLSIVFVLCLGMAGEAYRRVRAHHRRDGR